MYTQFICIWFHIWGFSQSPILKYCSIYYGKNLHKMDPWSSNLYCSRVNCISYWVCLWRLQIIKHLEPISKPFTSFASPSVFWFWFHPHCSPLSFMLYQLSNILSLFSFFSETANVGLFAWNTSYPQLSFSPTPTWSSNQTFWSHLSSSHFNLLLDLE